MTGGWSYPGATWPALTADQATTVEANLGLVAWDLNRRGIIGDEWDDAWQNGVLGLIRAVQKYDPAKGFRFSSYAKAWIANAVARGRAIEHGHHAQLALRFGEETVAPLSIDAPMDGDEFPLTDILPADDDTEGDASAAALLAAMAVACDDELDLAIIRGVAADRPLAQVAAACGRAESVARFRLGRIRSRLQALGFDLVAA